MPDEYQDQRVTVIEGDGISKVLAKAKRGELGTEGVPGTIEIMVRFHSAPLPTFTKRCPTESIGKVREWSTDCLASSRSTR